MNSSPHHESVDASNHSESSSAPQKLSAEERFAAFLNDSNDPELAAERQRDREKRQRLSSFLRTEYARLSMYIILTFLAIYIIVKVGNHLPNIAGGLHTGIRMSLLFLRPFINGMVIAYLLYPLMLLIKKNIERLPFVKHSKKKLRTRTIATILTMLITLGVILLALSLLFSTASHQVRMLHFDDIETLINSTAASVNDLYTAIEQRLQQANISSEALNEAVSSLSAWLRSYTTSLGANITGSLSNLTGIFTNLLFAVIFAIYFLLDTEGLTSYWDRVLKSISDRGFYRGFHLFLQDADYVFSGYIRGQIIDAIIMFILVSVSLTLVGVRFSILIGILTGIGNLIPYVGPFIAYGSTAVVCLLNGDIKKLIIAIIVLFIIQTIDGNIINPKLLSNAVDVHPMLVILALTAGSAVGGLLGMLVAVPVAALIKIWFDRGIDMLQEHKKKNETATKHL